MSYANGISTPGLVALPPWRSRLLFIALMLGLCGLLVRAVYLQGFQNDFLQQKGDARYSRVVKINAHRGMITDRNGKPLAISTPVESVWVSPQATVKVTAKQIAELAEALGMSAEAVKTRMSDTARDFVYLKRQLPPEQVASILKLEIPGVSSRREYRRYYPSADMTAHLLGFTNLDDKGQEGLELQLQSRLSGQVGSERVIKDRRGHIVEDVVSILAPQPGNDIALSIDNNLQYQAFREIKLAVEKHHAKSGSIVVLDAKSGEVLALANWPSYNPNNRAGVDFKTMRNHAITDIYEPGSTMKPFTIATALEVGKVT
ncbi:MAG: penicillin-binding protein 2, partial [Gallionellaceae bacterium]